MRFSVIMPVHNGGASIADALGSIAAQKCQPHEIIVINDRSTDNTLDQIKASGVDVRLFECDYGNAAAARNFGIEHATGDWLAFLDADDIWYPNHLEEATGLLQDTSDVGYFSLLDIIMLSTGEKTTCRNRWPVDPPHTALTHYDYLRFWNTYLFFHMITTIVRTDRFREIGGFDVSQRRRHDMEMWLRVIHGHTWSYNDAVTARYSGDTPGSISRENWASSEYYSFRSMVLNLDRYRDAGMPEMLKRSARRVLAAAYTDGGPEDQRRARELVTPYLKPIDRAVFSMVRLCPPVFRHANRLKRKLTRSKASRAVSR